MATKVKSKDPLQVGGTTSLDVEALRQIVEILEASEISRLDWTNGDERLTIRRGPPATQVVQHMSAPMPMSGPAVTVMPSHQASHAPSSHEVRPRPSAPTRAEGGAEKASDKKGHVITSPFVGTFYRSPAPDQPAYAEVGTAVKKGQVLCIIEAMKLMNEINAECDGEIVKVYVENGQAVHYGERLFAIKPSMG